MWKDLDKSHLELGAFFSPRTSSDKLSTQYSFIAVGHRDGNRQHQAVKRSCKAFYVTA